jgi:peptidoglycan/LPS O-acetylase OafA/YrhL
VRRLGHVPALDGIRGLGAVAVISAHYFPASASGAGYCIEVFFALSGFLITTLLLEERDRVGRVSLAAFYRRRAYRLLPALLTVLAAYAIATSASRLALEQIAVGAFYVTNIVMAAGSQLLYSGPLKPFWSLALEEQFYLFWPLLLLLLLRRHVRESRVALTLGLVFLVLVLYRAGLGLAGASWSRLYFGPDTHADALVLGCLLALLRRRGLRVPQWAGWVALTPFVAVIAWNLPLTEAAHEIAYGLAPLAIAAAVLVGAAIEPGLLSRCLSFRPLVWLGLISYSLYLWHLFVLWLFQWHEPLVALPFTVGVATLCYHKVEKPIRARARTQRSEPVPAEQPTASEAQTAFAPEVDSAAARA